MNLSQKIRDSIAKYDNSDCTTEILFRKNFRNSYGKNCSDTCVAEDNCTFSPRYCWDSCGNKYCDRILSECSLRSPNASTMNFSRSCRRPCPTPAPCSHNPYPKPMRLRYGSPYCPPECSPYTEPCVKDRCCDPCDEKACDSNVLSQNRIPRSRTGRYCGPRCPPWSSPCGSLRCRKPQCNYRYSRNCVKPRVYCDGPPCTPLRRRSPVRCASPCAPRCDPCHDPCKPRHCASPCPEPCAPRCDPCKPSRCAPAPCPPTKYCPPPRCGPCGPDPRKPCGPCPPKRSPRFCGPRSRCPPNCDSFKYPCFYYDKACNNICVKMVDGCAVPNSKNSCCEPLSSLFCSGSGHMFSISPYERDNCCGDYNYRINKLRSMSNLRSAIFDDCNDRCRPRRCPSPCSPGVRSCSPPRRLSAGGPCEPIRGPCEPVRGPCEPCEPDGNPCEPSGLSDSACDPCDPDSDACEPCRPRSVPCRPHGLTDSACEPCGPGDGPCPPCPPRNGPYRYDCYDPCKPCPPRRPCTRVKSLYYNDCSYESGRPYLDNCGRPKTCPAPISPVCNTPCKCSGCTMFGPSYCVQRSNCRIPCLCANYSCLPKFC